MYQHTIPGFSLCWFVIWIHAPPMIYPEILFAAGAVIIVEPFTCGTGLVTCFTYSSNIIAIETSFAFIHTYPIFKKDIEPLSHDLAETEQAPQTGKLEMLFHPCPSWVYRGRATEGVSTRDAYCAVA